MNKDQTYFDNNRNELLLLIPCEAKTILDVGCGSGNLGKLLKAKQTCEVHGVEINHNASEIARLKIDKVHNTSIENYLDIMPCEYFDCIILADVLEHLINPSFVLKSLMTSIKPDGNIIISIPNFCHYAVIKKIILGNFRYEESGILDDTHISFFTIGSIFRLLMNSGLKINEMILASLIENIDKDIIDILYEHCFNIGDFLSEANVFQYLINVQVNHNKDEILKSLISIILVAGEDVKKTKECIDNIYLYSREPYELIIINNSSNNDVCSYLDSLKDSTLIINEDKSISKALNTAIKKSKGNYFLLLNEGIIMTPKWLELITEKFTIYDNVGIVAPFSNNFFDSEKYYNKILENPEEFMKSRLYKSSINEESFLPWSCMMISRELIDKTGGFDTSFNFQSFIDDFCIRTNLSGYRILLTKDVFIYHHNSEAESVTEKEIALLGKDMQYFKNKWGIDNNSIYEISNFKEVINNKLQEENTFFSL